MRNFSYDTMEHKLKELEYEYDALEPVMDEETVRIHHDKHLQGYVNKLNEALKNNPELQEKTPEELISNLNEIPKSIRQAVINHGGGVSNHNLFFSILKKDTEISGKIKEAIESEFSSFENFKEKLSKEATTQFGSGWAWLVLTKDKKLKITKSNNQDSPLSNNEIPLIAIDVWEHSYYLKYQNKRPEYIENFFKIINWDKINKLYEQNL